MLFLSELHSTVPIALTRPPTGRNYKNIGILLTPTEQPRTDPELLRNTTSSNPSNYQMSHFEVPSHRKQTGYPGWEADGFARLGHSGMQRKGCWSLCTDIALAGLNGYV